MTDSKNKPVHEERIGGIKAAVWKHEAASGNRFTVKLTRSYRLAEDKRKNKKDDGWRESEYFDRDDLLNAAKVLSRAHDFIVDRGNATE